MPTANPLTTNYSPTKGYIAAMAAAVIWGVNGTMMQFLVTDRAINIEWLICLRLLVPGIILLIMAWMSPRVGAQKLLSIWRHRKDVIALLIFSIGLMGVQYTFIAAIKASNAATAVVIQFTAPVLVVVYYALKKRTWPAAKQWLAILLALLGTFFLVTKGNIYQIALSGAAVGWGLASSFALAFYSVQPIRLLKEYSAFTVTGWGMLIGAVWMSFFHTPWDVEGVWDSYTVAFFIFILLFGGLIAFTLYLSSVKIIGAYKTTLLISIEPLTVAILSICWLQMAFGLSDLLGAVCILSTIFLLTRKNAKLRPFRKKQLQK